MDKINKHHIAPKCLLKHKDKYQAVYKWLFMLTGHYKLESAWVEFFDYSRSIIDNWCKYNTPLCYSLKRSIING